MRMRWLNEKLPNLSPRKPKKASRNGSLWFLHLQSWAEMGISVWQLLMQEMDGEMRRAARVDANQDAVVSALRAAGASVQSLAAVGKGVPDLLVAIRGVNLLMEVKDGAKPPSARLLTEDQLKWHGAWNGPVSIVDGPESALRAIGVIK